MANLDGATLLGPLRVVRLTEKLQKSGPRDSNRGTDLTLGIRPVLTAW
jgi:hypothetical protein